MEDIYIMNSKAKFKKNMLGVNISKIIKPTPQIAKICQISIINTPPLLKYKKAKREKKNKP